MSITHKDLTKEAPRSPRIRIREYAILGRSLDKGRAALSNKEGEYHFDCPMDNFLFSFKGVTGEEIKALLLEGKSDDEIAAWLDTHGIPKSTEEIISWSLGCESDSPYHNPEKREWFAEECMRLGLNPEKATLFDMLEADDRQSFSKE